MSGSGCVPAPRSGTATGTQASSRFPPWQRDTCCLPSSPCPGPEEGAGMTRTSPGLLGAPKKLREHDHSLGRDQACGSLSIPQSRPKPAFAVSLVPPAVSRPLPPCWGVVLGSGCASEAWPGLLPQFPRWAAVCLSAICVASLGLSFSFLISEVCDRMSPSLQGCFEVNAGKLTHARC